MRWNFRTAHPQGRAPPHCSSACLKVSGPTCDRRWVIFGTLVCWVVMLKLGVLMWEGPRKMAGLEPTKWGQSPLPSLVMSSYCPKTLKSSVQVPRIPSMDMKTFRPQMETVSMETESCVPLFWVAPVTTKMLKTSTCRTLCSRTHYVVQSGLEVKDCLFGACMCVCVYILMQVHEYRRGCRILWKWDY